MPTPDQLLETKADLKQSIRILERRGAMRSQAQNEELKRLRAALRRVNKELSACLTQLRLF